MGAADIADKRRETDTPQTGDFPRHLGKYRVAREIYHGEDEAG